MIGPRIFNIDASLIKDFYIKETMRTQFRWELFNSINHPNWGDPSTNFYSGAFGTIASTRTAMRQMQLALKFIF